MTALNLEKAAKHQELMRERIQGLEMHEAFELIQDHAIVENVEMFEQAMERGDYSDVGYMFMKMLTFAATQDTAPDVERWADDVENEQAGQWRRNARIAQAANPDGVWLNSINR